MRRLLDAPLPVVAALAWAGAAWGGSCGAPGRTALLGLVLAILSGLAGLLLGHPRLALCLATAPAFAALGGWEAQREATPACAARSRVDGLLTDSRPVPGGRVVTLAPAGTRQPVEIEVRNTGVEWLDASPRVVPGQWLEVYVEPAAGRSRLEALSPSCVVPADREGAVWRQAAHLPARVRQAFIERARGRLVRGPHDRRGALLMALVTGRKEWLDPRDVDALRWSGLAHLAVVSGLHVGLVVLAAGSLASALAGSRHRAGQLFALAASASALVLLPATPPVRRAGLALLIAQAGRLLGRGSSAFHALAGAMLLLLALNPALSTSWSFGLTVSATLAILLAGARRRRFQAVVIALAPYLATWPLLIVMTGRASPWGAVANAVAGPAVPLALGAGWLAALCPELPVPAAVSFFESLARLASGWILRVAGEVSTWAGSGGYTPAVGWAWVTFHLAWLTRALVARDCSPPARAFTFGALGLSWSWPLLAPLAASAAQTAPAVCVLDVGQGQALLVRGTTGRGVLIDTGSVRASRDLRRGLVAAGVVRLDGVILTHLDEDHSGGTRSVLSGAAPRWLAIPESARGEPAAFRLTAASASRGVNVRWWSAGGVVALDGARVRVLWPEPGVRLAGNPGSFVLHLEVAGMSVLILGDAPGAREEWLAARRWIGPTDVMVASHHGAREGTTRMLLRQAAPRWVAVSSGPNNPFGHPAPEVLARVDALPAARWITAVSGGACWSPWKADGTRLAPLRVRPLADPRRWQSGVGGIRAPGWRRRLRAAPGAAGRAAAPPREGEDAAARRGSPPRPTPSTPRTPAPRNRSRGRGPRAPPPKGARRRGDSGTSRRRGCAHRRTGRRE